MDLNEAVRMVLARYSTIGSLVEAHKSLADSEETSKLLIECTMLYILYGKLNKPREVGLQLADKWNELCEINAPETV